MNYQVRFHPDVENDLRDYSFFIFFILAILVF